MASKNIRINIPPAEAGLAQRDFTPGDDDISKEYMDRTEEEQFQGTLSEIRELQESQEIQGQDSEDAESQGSESPVSDEVFFQRFVKNLEARTGINQLSPQNAELYDVRGLYDDPERDKLLGISPEDGKVHLSDKYKRPSHPTFTTESVHFHDQVSTPAGKRDEKSGAFVPAPGQLSPGPNAEELGFKTGDGITLKEAQEKGPFLSKRTDKSAQKAFFDFARKVVEPIDKASETVDKIIRGAPRFLANNLQNAVKSGGKDLRAIELGTKPDGKSFTVEDLVKTLTGDPTLDVEMVERLDLEDSPKTKLAVELASMILMSAVLKGAGSSSTQSLIFGDVLGADTDSSLANLFKEFNPEVRLAVVDLLTSDADDSTIEKMGKKLVGDGLLLEAGASGIKAFIDFVRAMKNTDGLALLKNEVGAVGEGVAELAAAKEIIKTPEFKKFFKGSKAVDEKGKPQIVYHGTDKDFDKFDTSKSADQNIWFTNRKDLIEDGEVGASGKGRIIPAYLSIKKPAGFEDVDKFSVDELIQKGFDGLILKDGDETTYAVFKSEQIKDIKQGAPDKTPKAKKADAEIERPTVTERQLGELPDKELEALLGPDFHVRAKGFFEEADARSFYETAGTVKDLGRMSQNFGRINSDEELLQAIAAVRDEFSEEILSHNPVTTLKEIAEKAKEKAKTLVSGEVGEAAAAVKAATITYNAARIVQVREAKNYKILEDLVQNGAGDDVVDMMERQFYVFGQISEKVQALKKAIAVAQGSGRIVAEVDSTVGGQLYADRLAAIRADFPGAIKGRELAQKTSLLTSPEQLEMLARGGIRPGFFEFFMEYWINAILSGPQTHIVNGGGNAIKAVWTIPERFLSGAINKVFRGNHPDSVQMEEARELLYGAMGGVRDMMDFIWKFGSGRSTVAERAVLAQDMTQSIAEGGRKSQIREPVISGKNVGLKGGVVSKAIDWMGSVIRIPTAMLGIEDAGFKFFLKRMERRALAFNRAKKARDPRTGEPLSAEQMDLMINKILADPDDIMVGAVQDFADYNTFQARLGKVGQNVSKLVRSAPFMRLGIPFHVTPTNIGKDVLLSLPTGLLDGDAALRLSAKINQDIKRGLSASATGPERRAADLALGKISAGSMMSAYAVQMAADGRLTGPWAKDPALKEAQRVAGFQAFSFRYIDEETGKLKYISFSRIEPHGTFFGLAATFAQFAGSVTDQEAEGMAALLAMSVSEQMTSKTYLKGMAEIVHAIEDNRWNRFMTKLAGSMMPNFVAQTNRGLDPVMRETQGAFDKILSRTWGFSTMFPPRRNIFGDAVLYGPGIGPDTAGAMSSVLNPLWLSEEKENLANDERIRHQIPIRVPGRSIDGIPLDVWQRDYFITASAGIGWKGLEPLEVTDGITVPAGLNLRKALEYVIKTDSYQGMTGGHALSQKSMIIMGIVSAYRKIGKMKTRERFPKLEAAIQARKRLKEQGRLSSETQRETPRESFERKQSANSQAAKSKPGSFQFR